MKQLYNEKQLYHFDGKLYKIEPNNLKINKITLVWQRDEIKYQKERNRLHKQLEKLMK